MSTRHGTAGAHGHTQRSRLKDRTWVPTTSKVTWGQRLRKVHNAVDVRRIAPRSSHGPKTPFSGPARGPAQHRASVADTGHHYRQYRAAGHNTVCQFAEQTTTTIRVSR
eukprot:2862101-Rhodomonas_salina.1